MVNLSCVILLQHSTLPQLPPNKPRRHAPSASFFFLQPGRGILVWLDSFHDKVKTNMPDLTDPVQIATFSLHLVCQVPAAMATSTGITSFDMRVEAGDAFGTNRSEGCCILYQHVATSTPRPRVSLPRHRTLHACLMPSGSLTTSALLFPGCSRDENRTV